MNITKVTTEVYNWDAAINLSKEQAVKFAKDVLELCGETLSNAKKDYPVKDKSIKNALKSMPPVTYVTDKPDIATYDIFMDDAKLRFEELIQSYSKSLLFAMDLSSSGWRMPTIVDVINNQNALYKHYGDDLYNLYFWTNAKGSEDKTQKCVSFEKATEGTSTFKYHVHQRDKSLEASLMLIRD
jgi:hypothetical protein